MKFSQLSFWQELHSYYQQKQEQAWTLDQLPMHATNNPAMGHMLAILIHDWVQTNAIQAPVKIMEWGSGMGFLPFYLNPALDTLRLAPQQVTLTDIYSAPSHLHHRIDQLRRQYPKTHWAYRTLELSPTNNHCLGDDDTAPLVVLANYLVDSLPADLYQYHDNQWQSCEFNTDVHLADIHQAPDQWLPNITHTPSKHTSLPSAEQGQFGIDCPALTQALTLAKQRSGPTLLLITDKGWWQTEDRLNSPLEFIISHQNAVSLPVDMSTLAHQHAGNSECLFHRANLSTLIMTTQSRAPSLPSTSPLHVADKLSLKMANHHYHSAEDYFGDAIDSHGQLPNLISQLQSLPPANESQVDDWLKTLQHIHAYPLIPSQCLTWAAIWLWAGSPLRAIATIEGVLSDLPEKWQAYAWLIALHKESGNEGKYHSCLERFNALGGSASHLTQLCHEIVPFLRQATPLIS